MLYAVYGIVYALHTSIAYYVIMSAQIESCLIDRLMCMSAGICRTYLHVMLINSKA